MSTTFECSGQGRGRGSIPEWGDDASPNWSESEWRSFGDPNGEYFGGGWEGEPGTLLCDPYPYDEVCIMISGPGGADRPRWKPSRILRWGSIFRAAVVSRYLGDG